jgi:hypothetical protein
LKRQHVAGRERNDAIGIGGAGKFGEGSENRLEIFGGAVVGTTTMNGRPERCWRRTVMRALAAGLRPDTLIRPVLSRRWEDARRKAGSRSTSAKISRTNGRSMLR